MDFVGQKFTADPKTPVPDTDHNSLISTKPLTLALPSEAAGGLLRTQVRLSTFLSGHGSTRRQQALMRA